MKKLLSIPVIISLSLMLMFSVGSRSQQQTVPKLQAAPVTTVTVDGSEAMFTTMCALLASGYEADVSATNWAPMRAQLRDRMQHQSGPAVEVMRNFYKQHELADPGQMLSRYIWFGLISGPAPKLVRTDLTSRRVAARGDRARRVSGNSFELL